MMNYSMSNREIYVELIKGVNILLERKIAERQELEAAKKDNDTVYASVLNEIGTLKRVNNDFMLFKG